MAADSPPPTEPERVPSGLQQSERVPSGLQQSDRVPSGMYCALPICVADSPLPREDPPPPLAEGRRAFVDSMLKAEKVSLFKKKKNPHMGDKASLDRCG